MWSEPSIPVLTTEVETPLDVLEVYTRINRGGVQVAGNDVYLAAVKTFWPEAERTSTGWRKHPGSWTEWVLSDSFRDWPAARSDKATCCR